MAEVEYRQLRCRDIGNDCDFLVRARNEGELLHYAHEHLCEAHDVCAIPSELKDKIDIAIKTVWCRGGQCNDVSQEVEIPPWL